MYVCNDCNNEFDDEEISVVKKLKMTFYQGKLTPRKVPVEYCPCCDSEDLEYIDEDFEDDDFLDMDLEGDEL